MSETGIAESVERADRLSKVVALVFALGAYFLTVYLTDDVNFSLIIAAVSAIGVRFFIPHWASAGLENPEENGIHAHPATGDFHHGALGIALIIGPAVAVAVILSGAGSSWSLLGGGIASAFSFPLLRTVLRAE
ncbi:MAG: hypothetical protein V5A52_06910 [Halovenus sp.]